MTRLLLAIAACLLLSGCGKSGGGQSSPQPPSAPPVYEQPLGPSRRGLFFAYFGADLAQIDQTRDHVNMLFAAKWGYSEAEQVAMIAAAQMPAILDVSDCLFTDAMPREFRGVEASTLLRARLQACEAAGVLQHVAALYLIDEPELADVRATDIALASLACVRVAVEFFPSPPALHICYSAREDYRGFEHVDWIGVNHYDGDALGKIERLRPMLEAHQRIVLYPGGADPWRNDPRPSFAYAQQTPEVAGICAFLWVALDEGRQAGIRDNGTAAAYREVGLAIKQANEPGV